MWIEVEVGTTGLGNFWEFGVLVGERLPEQLVHVSADVFFATRETLRHTTVSVPTREKKGDLPPTSTTTSTPPSSLSTEIPHRDTDCYTSLPGEGCRQHPTSVHTP